MPQRRRGRVGTEQAREREQRAWQMRIKHATHAAIAAALGVSFQAVSKMLQRVRARMERELAAEVALWKTEERARLEHVVDEAMQAWERSKTDAHTATKKTAKDGGTEVEKVTLKSSARYGDIRYLGEARAALAELRKLDGLNAPARKSRAAPSASEE